MVADVVGLGIAFFGAEVSFLWLLVVGVAGTSGCIALSLMISLMQASGIGAPGVWRLN